ncbi:MAG: reverse transcriptase domain-containing protein [Sedimenticola sp.]
MEYIHFKMETLKAALDAMRPQCFFGSVDLSEAYFSIPVRLADRKYFRFWHYDQKYQFTCLVMGLATAPRVFTKVLKPVFSTLRSRGHVSTAYVDDSCLQGATFQECEVNIRDTVELMDDLGLTVHPEKSQLIPCKQIVFLGFLLCSETMTVRLTNERILDLKGKCVQILRTKRITIREFSALIGKMVAAEPGVAYATLHFKPLEKVKDYYLRLKRGNFDAFMSIPQSSRETIQWWVDNLDNSVKPISPGKPSIVLYSDASTIGWGVKNQTMDLSTGGLWSVAEQECHINILELKACQLGLLSMCKDKENVHVRVYMDNTTSCAYINKLGGRKQVLDELAREIWFWCIERHIHLSAAHVPGIVNTEADELSRKFNDDLEWSLSDIVFTAIYKLYPDMSVDLFASRLNNKLIKYVSRRLEPNAIAVDAFSLTWEDELYYIFGPFSLTARILQKVAEDQTRAIMVAPLWTTQSWWASLLHHICGPAFLLPRAQTILTLPHKPGIQHPLTKLRLGVFPISGRHCEVRAYQEKLPILSSDPGGPERRDNTIRTLNNGCVFAVQNKLIHLNPLLP